MNNLPKSSQRISTFKKWYSSWEFSFMRRLSLSYLQPGNSWVKADLWSPVGVCTEKEKDYGNSTNAKTTRMHFKSCAALSRSQHGAALVIHSATPCCWRRSGLSSQQRITFALCVGWMLMGSDVGLSGKGSHHSKAVRNTKKNTANGWGEQSSAPQRTNPAPTWKNYS